VTDSNEIVSVGDPAVFSIESGILRAYPRLGARALGFFGLYIKGARFGVMKPDATLLACSYDAVLARIRLRGMHHCPIDAENADVEILVDAINTSRYGDVDNDWKRLGYSRRRLDEVLTEANAWWAPDGDEAFDDNSRVLQFDLPDGRVLLLGFRSAEPHRYHDVAMVTIEAVRFYGALADWVTAFDRARDRLLEEA